MKATIFGLFLIIISVHLSFAQNSAARTSCTNSSYRFRNCYVGLQKVMYPASKEFPMLLHR